jgi:hypothetical protein
MLHCELSLPQVCRQCVVCWHVKQHIDQCSCVTTSCRVTCYVTTRNACCAGRARVRPASVAVGPGNISRMYLCGRLRHCSLYLRVHWCTFLAVACCRASFFDSTWRPSVCASSGSSSSVVSAAGFQLCHVLLPIDDARLLGQDYCCRGMQTLQHLCWATSAVCCYSD